MEPPKSRSLAGIASPPESPEKKAIPFLDLANIFDLAVADLQRDKEQGQELCFKAALGAIERGEWEVLNQAKKNLLNLENSSGQSLLTACVEKGMEGRVRELIDRQMAWDFSGGHYEYAFHTAARRGNIPLLALLWNIAGIDQRDAEGKTALHIAIEHGQTAAVEALVGNGASTRSSFRGLSAPHWAVARGAIEALDVLVKRGKKVELDVSVPQFGNVLHIAIQFGQTPLLRHLLTTHAPKTRVLLRQPNGTGRTPLMEAAYLGDVEAIVLLKEKGADLEQLDSNDRTALHWAALGQSQEAIQVLVYLGAKIKAADAEGRKPLELVRGKTDPLSITLFNTLDNLEKQGNKVKREPPRFSIRPPQNLVFKGGGPKGIAYIGAIQVLEEKGLLRELCRVAGTSAGAITAAAISMNYNATETLNLLDKTPLTSFLDHPFTTDRLQEALSKNLTLKRIWDILNNPTHLVNPMQWIKGLWKTTGVCKGEVFRKWMEELIHTQTEKYLGEGKGIHHLTFGELDELIKKGAPFKELHVFSLKVGENPEICHFHVGDPRWRDLVISDAVRASMSIPGVFIPHTLHFKDSQDKRYPRPDLGSYMDGGMLNNLPIETFDQKGYVYNGLTAEDSAAPTFNRRTLGFSLYSASEKEPVDDKPLDSIGDVLISLVRLHKQAEQLIRQRTPYNQHRIIEIDNKGVGLLDFNLKPDDQRKLIHSGRISTDEFFAEETGSIGGFILPTLETKERFVSLSSPLASFVPRGEYLAYLRATLIPTNWTPHTPLKRCVLYGLGGVGKTELACYFGNEERAHYSLLFWLDSETRENLRSSYESLARALGLYIEKRDDLDAIRNHVHNRLEQQKEPWLLIYDNVNEKLSLPQRGGFVLITTQHGNLWQEDSCHVGPFSPAEGLQLLEKACPTSSLQERKDLIGKLDCFPLALGQAAAYLSEEGTSIPHYLSELSRPSFRQEGTERHSDSLARTWGVTLKSLQVYHHTALAWLTCCAYLDPSAIPEGLLEKWLSKRSEASDNNNNNNADLIQRPRDLLRILKRYNLISWDSTERHFSLHRLMQGLLRTEDTGQAESNLQMVMEALQNSYTDQRPSTDELKHKLALLPHFEAVLKHAQGLDKPPVALRKALAETLYLTGDLHYHLGSYRQAASILERALELSASIWGRESLEASRYLNKLGSAYYSKGQYDQAIEYHQRALAIKEKALGKDHPNVATSLGGLGSAYHGKGQYDQAIEYHQRALAIWEKALGKDHPNVVISLGNLGNAYESKGQYDQAIEYHQRALAIGEKALGKDHPNVAISLGGLGNAYHGKGQYDQAIECHQRALAIEEKALGKDHPNVAFSLYSLGNAYHGKGQYDQAIEYHQRALAIREKALGKDHPNVAFSLGGLGSAYHGKGQYDQAIEYHQRALAIWEKALGKDHPNVVISLGNLGNAYESKGQYDQAIEYHQRALAIGEKALGKDHPHTIWIRNNLKEAKRKKSDSCAIM